jgi:hypothetical protein
MQRRSLPVGRTAIPPIIRHRLLRPAHRRHVHHDGMPARSRRIMTRRRRHRRKRKRSKEQSQDQAREHGTDLVPRAGLHNLCDLRVRQDLANFATRCPQGLPVGRFSCHILEEDDYLHEGE